MCCEGRMVHGKHVKDSGGCVLAEGDIYKEGESQFKEENADLGLGLTVRVLCSCREKQEKKVVIEKKKEIT